MLSNIKCVTVIEWGIGMSSKLVGFITACIISAVSSATHAEIIDYACSSNNGGRHTIHINTRLKFVRQKITNGLAEGTAEFSDGIFGKLAESGMISLVGAAKQFVRIDNDAIYFGIKLHGDTEQGTSIDRRTRTIIYSDGTDGVCSALPKSCEIDGVLYRNEGKNKTFRLFRPTDAPKGPDKSKSGADLYTEQQMYFIQIENGPGAGAALYTELSPEEFKGKLDSPECKK